MMVTSKYNHLQLDPRTTLAERLILFLNILFVTLSTTETFRSATYTPIRTEGLLKFQRLPNGLQNYKLGDTCSLCQN